VTRPLRLDFPGAIHHVAALAIENEVAFREQADRSRFIGQLEKMVELYKWKCGSFCLMGTHFHLVLNTPEATLSRGMQHLCGAYAQWFNWKYGRRGHLFGRRFGSVEILDDTHLLNAYRYVALNPVRAGICERPESWRWGSYRALLGLETPPAFLDVAGVLELFSNNSARAQVAFREFVESDQPDDEEIPLVRIPGK
jgi:putative transposase